MMTGFSREKTVLLLLKARKRVLSVVIVIITLIVSSVIYRNQSEKIEALRVKEDAELKRNDVLNEISRAEKTIKLYKNLFPRKDIASVTNAINGMARESKVSVISFKPGNEQSQQLYVATPLNLAIESDSYHSIGNFISRMERQAEAYFLNSLTIKTRGDSGDKITANLTLSIITFKGR